MLAIKILGKYEIDIIPGLQSVEHSADDFLSNVDQATPNLNKHISTSHVQFLFMCLRFLHMKTAGQKFTWLYRNRVYIFFTMPVPCTRSYCGPSVVEVRQP